MCCGWRLDRGLIREVPAWFGYRQMRNTTAHTCDPHTARQVYEGIPDFLLDACQLLRHLEGLHD
jgi:hypothetical protein